MEHDTGLIRGMSSDLCLARSGERVTVQDCDGDAESLFWEFVV